MKERKKLYKAGIYNTQHTILSIAYFLFYLSPPYVCLFLLFFGRTHGQTEGRRKEGRKKGNMKIDGLVFVFFLPDSRRSLT